jgi:hypothetical protein
MWKYRGLGSIKVERMRPSRHNRANVVWVPGSIASRVHQTCSSFNNDWNRTHIKIEKQVLIFWILPLSSRPKQRNTYYFPWPRYGTDSATADISESVCNPGNCHPTHQRESVLLLKPFIPVWLRSYFLRCNWTLRRRLLLDFSKEPQTSSFCLKTTPFQVSPVQNHVGDNEWSQRVYLF